jgi:hypothetical protein
MLSAEAVMDLYSSRVSLQAHHDIREEAKDDTEPDSALSLPLLLKEYFEASPVCQVRYNYENLFPRYH